MTDTPKRLLRKAATALSTCRAQAKEPDWIFNVQYAAPTADDLRDAQAVLDACEVELMLGVLRDILDNDGGEGSFHAVKLHEARELARAILARHGMATTARNGQEE